MSSIQNDDSRVDGLDPVAHISERIASGRLERLDVLNAIANAELYAVVARHHSGDDGASAERLRRSAAWATAGIMAIDAFAARGVK